jgi:hypothetical protein
MFTEPKINNINKGVQSSKSLTEENGERLAPK